MECKISIEDTSSVGKNINIEIPRGILQERIQRALRRATPNVQLKGFRRGHAPLAMVERMYGDRIRHDVISELVSEAYETALREHTIRVVGAPQISIEDKDQEKDVLVTAAVAIFPEPKLKGYFGVKLEVETDELTNESVDRAIEEFRERFAELEPVTDRTEVEDKDVVLADFAGTVDGQPFQGSDGKDVNIEIGSGRSLPGVEAGLIGALAGEEREISTILPESAGEELAGKTALYRVRVLGIKKKKLPALDDEFAKTSGLAENVEDLRDKFRARLAEEVEKTNRAAKEERLFQALIEKHEFDVPDPMVDEEIRQMLFEMNWLDSSKNESYQLDMTPFRKGFSEHAGFRVRRNVILSGIIKQEAYFCTDEDVNAWLDTAAARAKETREKINEWYSYPSRLDRLREIVGREKMLEKLLAEAKITETKKIPAIDAQSEEEPKKKRDKKAKKDKD